MKKKSARKSAFVRKRILVSSLCCFVAALLAFAALAQSPGQAVVEQPAQTQAMQAGVSYHNDISPPLRDLALAWPPPFYPESEAQEANPNPHIPNQHVDKEDPVVQDSFYLQELAPNIPSTILNFDGIPYPGVGCNCLPPDTNGAVGATQYVQMVNKGYQVFNKANGASMLGPSDISTVWSGFGGVCQTNGRGDPVVLYDRIANRWVISQFAGSPPTDECIAVSTTSDATGSYFRYAFHLGTNFYDYPHLSVWRDGYYMADNVFNAAGTARLGPQAFVFERSAMLTGAAATFITPGITGGPSEPYFLPADLDGSNLPGVFAPATFVSWPGTGVYKIWHFSTDFSVPSNSTFTLFASPAAAGFTRLCAGTRNCVPQSGTSVGLDALGDRLMFRAAYRKFADHESVVINYTVSANSVAGIRWVELRDVTFGPVTVFQESTYQPDTTWRWMGSIAMDKVGNIALGYAASSSSIFPGIRYTGRLSTDPLNTLPQGEGVLFAGTGSQTSSSNRWGDYSAMTIDPVDDCTFWYTQEYSATTTGVNWHTRIGSFSFPECVNATPTPTPTPSPSPTPMPTPSPTPSPSPTPTPLNVTVSLPVATVDTSVTNFSQPVTVSAINAADHLIGFQGDFTFDSAVVSFQNPPVTATGLTGGDWNVSANVQPGAGPTRTLRISAFVNDGTTPLSGPGTLFALNLVRVSSTPGANTPLTWAASPNDFEFIDANVDILLPSSAPPGSITVIATASISGQVAYCSSLNPVPGVTLTLAGSASGSTQSNGSGNYTIASLTPGGNYTVTPSGTPVAPGSAGINTVDVLAVQRHFLNLAQIPPGCGLTAAEVNGDTQINTIDVVAIQRFFLGLTTGTANVGKYNFIPASRAYPALSGNQTGQNYDALIYGDVVSAFVF